MYSCVKWHQLSSGLFGPKSILTISDVTNLFSGSISTSVVEFEKKISQGHIFDQLSLLKIAQVRYGKNVTFIDFPEIQWRPGY